MKEITTFQCEICGTQFKSKQVAEECENAHKKIKKVTAIKYRPYTSAKDGIPDWINVEFDNGKTIRYTRG